MKNISNYNQFINENLTDFKEHSYFIPTYEQCRQICDANDNFLFYELKTEIEGYHISMFNYRLATFTHFESPIPNRSDISAKEMRGLTFIFNKDGYIYNRYLLLDKFFNVDQTPCSMYSIVKNYKIKNIYNKEDGSIASFIKLPNGKVFGKSKMSFESDQAIEIQKIYDEDVNIKRIVNYFLNNDIMPIFEFVSPRNRIVVPYANTELILLRLRNNSTGEYLDINDYSHMLEGVSIAPSITGHTLDDIKEVVLKMVDKEGVIVQFENGKMVKIKSPWYCSLHGLVTDKLNRENDIIELILNDHIDDVFSQIPEDDERIDKINDIIDIVNNEILKLSKELDNLLSKYTGDMKKFAIENIKNPLFSIAAQVIKGKDQIDEIKSRIRKETSHLMDAREWVNSRMNNNI